MQEMQAELQGLLEETRMSIIIKGMEMPRGCNYCHRSYWSNIDQVYKCYLTKSKLQIKDAMTERNADCPMVEIPKGAKLIDARDVKKHMIPLDFSVQNWISEVDLDSRVPVFFEEEPIFFEEEK